MYTVPVVYILCNFPHFDTRGFDDSLHNHKPRFLPRRFPNSVYSSHRHLRELETEGTPRRLRQTTLLHDGCSHAHGWTVSIAGNQLLDR